MKKYSKKIILTTVITILPMLIGLVLWNKLPPRIITHWGNQNQADGWSSKPYAVFVPSLILAFVHIISIFFVLNDPKKKNIHSKMLTVIFWIIPATSWTVNLMVYGTAMGMHINVGIIANLIIGVLFIVFGNYVPKSRQSYTVGVRLPWTLDNAKNWSLTSRLQGKVWTAGGIIYIMAAFLQINVLLVPLIIVMVLIPTAYSFILYKKGI